MAPLESDYLAVMPSRVTVQPLTGRDLQGRATYGAGVEYHALLEANLRRVTTLDGREVISSVTIYLGGAPAITGQERLTVPAGYGLSTHPQILSVGRVDDERGPHHVVFYC